MIKHKTFNTLSYCIAQSKRTFAQLLFLRWYDMINHGVYCMCFLSSANNTFFHTTNRTWPLTVSGAGYPPFTRACRNCQSNHRIEAKKTFNSQDITMNHTLRRDALSPLASHLSPHRATNGEKPEAWKRTASCQNYHRKLHDKQHTTRWFRPSNSPLARKHWQYLSLKMKALIITHCY